MQNRRTFLGQIGTGAMLAGLPLSLESLREFVPAVPSRDASSWDVSWTTRVTGKYRAVFDVAAIDSGHGTWRASVWQKQYADVLKARPRDMSTVLVLRAKGIALADHARHLIAHGMLHLLGLDHGDDTAAAHMEGLETAALATLGLADPYAERD